MADTGNILFDVSTKVGGEIFKAKKQALKATPVEFSYKKGNVQDWRNAVKNNADFRQQQLDKLGVDGFLDKWGGRRNGTEQ
tara:strand:- start:2798 stop:3040 length:243 start_codon:yes stop_codon:yes gene_type:complete